ncbi:MAG TPA: hypothetical protein HA252_04805, partial [Candidatus Diapherotrites archaeon]|nr:hypothetical protein [Candidatus Diapherotrites archaeon]
GRGNQVEVAASYGVNAGNAYLIIHPGLRPLEKEPSMPLNDEDATVFSGNTVLFQAGAKEAEKLGRTLYYTFSGRPYAADPGYLDSLSLKRQATALDGKTIDHSLKLRPPAQGQKNASPTRFEGLYDLCNGKAYAEDCYKPFYYALNKKSVKLEAGNGGDSYGLDEARKMIACSEAFDEGKDKDPAYAYCADFYKENADYFIDKERNDPITCMGNGTCTTLAIYDLEVDGDDPEKSMTYHLELDKQVNPGSDDEWIGSNFGLPSYGEYKNAVEAYVMGRDSDTKRISDAMVKLKDEYKLLRLLDEGFDREYDKVDGGEQGNNQSFYTLLAEFKKLDPDVGTVIDDVLKNHGIVFSPTYGISNGTNAMEMSITLKDPSAWFNQNLTDMPGDWSVPATKVVLTKVYHVPAAPDPKGYPYLSLVKLPEDQDYWFAWKCGYQNQHEAWYKKLGNGVMCAGGHLENNAGVYTN